MKARWRVTTFLATAVFTLIFAGPGWAQNRCSASKIKVTAKKQKLQLRRTISVVAAHSFTVAEELSEDGGPFVRLGSAVFTKVGAK